MHKEPRIIYSLSAFPLINNRWFQGNKLKETIYMTALSVLYSHLWYEDIELYVDETAYKYLYMLPCKVTLINIDKHKELWMKSKIHAMAQQNKPFVHIDTDVFITKKIDFNFKNCLLERKEGTYKYHYKNQVAFFSKYTSHLEHWHTDLGYSFSCGILGFNNMELKNEFINAYYALEDIFIRNRSSYQPLKERGYEPCIVIEQYNLASLLNSKNIKPNLLIKGTTLEKQSEAAKSMGYNHLFGIAKYRKSIAEEIEHQLYKIFPYWYAQVKIALEEDKVIMKDTSRI